MAVVTFGPEKVVAAAAAAGGGSFWTPQNIRGIIQDIAALMAQYHNLKNLAGGVNNEVLESQHDSGPHPVNPSAPAITMAHVIALGKQVCDNLEKQGHGDKTILQVLEQVPFTVKQLKAMLPK